MTETELKLNEAINTIARGQIEMYDKMESLITGAIEKKINGKFTQGSPTYLLQGLDDHIKRTEPIIQAYEDSIRREEDVKKLSGVIVKIGATVTAIATIIAALKYILTGKL